MLIFSIFHFTINIALRQQSTSISVKYMTCNTIIIVSGNSSDPLKLICIVSRNSKDRGRWDINASLLSSFIASLWSTKKHNPSWKINTEVQMHYWLNVEKKTDIKNITLKKEKFTKSIYFFIAEGISDGFNLDWKSLSIKTIIPVDVCRMLVFTLFLNVSQHINLTLESFSIKKSQINKS